MAATEQIRAVRKTVIGLGAMLFIASMATCYFGMQHEIGQIPQNVRARMSDTDWVGAEWAVRSVLLDVIAFSLVATGFLLWVYERRKFRATNS